MRYILLIVVIVNMISCVLPDRIEADIHSPRFDPPELSAHPTEINVGFGFSDYSQVTLVQNAFRSPPELDTVEFDALRSFSFYFGFPLYPRIEVSLDNKHGGQLRYQFLGKKREDALPGDLSATASIGLNRQHVGIPETEVNYKDDFSYEYDWSMDTYSANIIFGKRLSNRWLLYGGPMFSSYKLQGNLLQYEDFTPYDSFDNKTTSELSLDNSGFQSGFGLAIEFAFDAGFVEQAIVYQLQSTLTSWGDFTSDVEQKHSLTIRHYF